MNTRLTKMRKPLRKALCTSLVLATYAGGSAVVAGVRREEPESERTAETIRVAAAQGDAQALYWLAMMHIEGTIAGADYEHGMELLKTASRRGNKDAERMFAFMDNAFSGEGC